MEIKTVPISKVENWSKNPRNIKIKDFERLKKQLLKLKQYRPLICYQENGKYITLGGNMRLRALKDLGIKEVDISIVYPKTEAEKIEFSLSDNDRAGEYDEQGLAELLHNSLDEIEIDLFKIDFGNTMSIETLLSLYGPDMNPTDEDYLPKGDQDPITKYGELYEIGRHRLLCADATDPEAYKHLMAGKKADLVFTDPPYNVAYQGDNYAPIMNDDLTEEGFILFVEAFIQQLKENTKKGGVFYICAGYTNFSAIVWAIKKAGMIFTAPIIWVENIYSMRFTDYKKNHEMMIKAKQSRRKAGQPIIYGWNEGRHYFVGDRGEADVWEFKRRATQVMLHPTQKPLGLIQRAIKNSSRPAEIILDPFAGSGSTMIAAERENRTAYLMEIDPVYIDIIIRRFAALGITTQAKIRKTKKQTGLEAKR